MLLRGVVAKAREHRHIKTDNLQGLPRLGVPVPFIHPLHLPAHFFILGHLDASSSRRHPPRDMEPQMPALHCIALSAQRAHHIFTKLRRRCRPKPWPTTMLVFLLQLNFVPYPLGSKCSSLGALRFDDCEP